MRGMCLNTCILRMFEDTFSLGAAQLGVPLILKIVTVINHWEVECIIEQKNTHTRRHYGESDLGHLPFSRCQIDDIFFFFFFSRKTGFDISCKLSALETICMKF